MQKCARLILVSLALSALAFGQEPSPSAPELPRVLAEQTASPSAPPIELKPDASGAVPQEQISELLRRVAEKDLANEKRLRDYTYIEREEERIDVGDPAEAWGLDTGAHGYSVG